MALAAGEPRDQFLMHRVRLEAVQRMAVMYMRNGFTSNEWRAVVRGRLELRAQSCCGEAVPDSGILASVWWNLAAN